MSSATQTPPHLAIIPHVPNIMRAQGWDTAAHFMETWLEGRAHDFSTYDADSPHQRDTYLSSLSIQWVLSFPRARAVFNRIFNGGPLAQLHTWQRLYALLVHRYPRQTDGDFNFGTGHPRQIESQGLMLSHLAAGTLLRQHAPGAANWRTPRIPLPNINVRIPDNIPGIGGSRIEFDRDIPSVGVGDKLDQASQVVSMDGLAGALARFTLCTTVNGSVQWRGGRIARIIIRELCVYIRDSFDFNGRNQPLGTWRANPPSVTFAPLNALPGDDWIYLNNGTFQDWRAATGKGRDFIVYSDILRMPLSPTVQMTFQ